MSIKGGQLKEKEDYQKYILEALSEDNGYEIRPATSFSAGYGMDVDVLFAFLEDTQKETLTRLEKLYKAFSPKVCLHFGDIDVGGFMIFNNLVQSTDISFLPYHMGIEELEIYKDKAKPLTANDVSRLQKLHSDPEFAIFEVVIEYMLAHNLKLEQEALD